MTECRQQSLAGLAGSIIGRCNEVLALMTDLQIGQYCAKGTPVNILRPSLPSWLGVRNIPQGCRLRKPRQVIVVIVASPITGSTNIYTDRNTGNIWNAKLQKY